MSRPVLELRHVTKRYGSAAAVRDVSFAVQSGQIVALLGPSGCGKTTTLRMIAGFVAPDAGEIEIAGRDMRKVRPHERSVGLVFQDYALFPHLSVGENVAYGLRQRGDSKDGIARRVREMLELVRLDGFADRRPMALSGGQQQRVALARAMAVTPAVMLLDEPLSALDAKLRQQLRLELKHILRSAQCTTLVVTHDQEEAMSLADQIVVMDQGCVLQHGQPSAIYHAPATRVVADFIGRANWFEGTPGRLLAPDLREFATADGRFVVRCAPRNDGATVAQFCVRPERLRMLLADEPVDDGVNIVDGTLAAAVHLGPEIHHAVTLESGRTIICIEQNRDQPIPAAGTRIRLAFRPSDCIVTR
ncbi:MAG TPA: ABC transporter ATP-binding protein [Casimicrobiaceae bacterium]|nr:ABC transporter ATP-binding protein [Casimicrobiaceae bacterium]